MLYDLYTIMFPNGKVYVGITSVGAQQRFAGHCRSAKTGSRLPVHRAIAKYGEGAIVVTVIETGDRDAIRRREIEMISLLGTTDRSKGYNVALGGDISPMHSSEVAASVSAAKRKRIATDPEFAEMLRQQAIQLNSPSNRAKANAAIRTPEVSAAKSAKLTGWKHSDAVRANMSAAQRAPSCREEKSRKARAAWASPELRAEQSARNKGKVIPPEQRAKISAALMGHPGYGKGIHRPPEIGAKISAAKMGHPVSADSRAKMSASQRGRTASEETRKKLSAAATGRNLGVPKSDEVKRKISESLKGRTASAETRAKIGAAQKGRVFSEETRQRMSDAAKRRRSRARSSVDEPMIIAAD